MAGNGGRAGGAGPIDVDVLFMIDNTIHMPRSQRQLQQSFPAFTQALAALPGGMPNLHLAVVSSDMGAGTATDGCFDNGQNGSFQVAPRQTVSGFSCETTLQNGARFISNVGGVTNYNGDLVDVLSCIAPLGDAGCNFEQPLLSVMHALGADNIVDGVPQPPIENAGFLRPDAYLVIVLLTNEDDCSAPGGSANDLFPRATEAKSVTAPCGAPNGYRCNRYGHLCGEPKAPPPSEVPDPNAPVTLTDCIPAEGAGKLIPVAEVEAAIKALKREPSRQIVVAAITGVYPAPSAAYVVEWAAPLNIAELWPDCSTSAAAGCPTRTVPIPPFASPTGCAASATTASSSRSATRTGPGAAAGRQPARRDDGPELTCRARGVSESEITRRIARFVASTLRRPTRSFCLRGGLQRP